MVVFKQKFNENMANSVSKHQTKKVMPILVGCCAILLIIGILFIVFREDDSDLYCGIYIVAMAVILPLIFFIALVVGRRSQGKNMPMLGEDSEIVFTFDEHEVTVVQTKADMFESRMRATYGYIYKVEETRTHYFLYINKVQMQVIDKSCITQGTIEELNSYFINNLVYKYKQRR